MITSRLRSALTLAAAATLALNGLPVQAQPAQGLVIPQPSPTATLKQRVGLTDIEITYSRPGMKGRKIFGELEPYGEVWRAGANNATKVVFSTPVKVGGTEVPAGTYGLFALLGKDQWTLILNKISKQWGAYQYNQQDDVLRVPATLTMLKMPVETFTIDINDIRDDSATLNLTWENTRASVKLEFDVVGQVKAQIEAAMAQPNDKSPYVGAAMFYLDHGLDLRQANAWMDAAIKLDPKGYYLHYRKAKVQAKMGDKAGAIATAKQSIEIARADSNVASRDEYIRLNEALIASLN